MLPQTAQEFEEAKRQVAQIKKYAASRNLHCAENRIPYPREFRELEEELVSGVALKIGRIGLFEVLADVNGNVVKKAL
jgi:hypothetical protein